MMRLVLLCALLRVLSRNEIRELRLIEFWTAFSDVGNSHVCCAHTNPHPGLAQQLGFALDNIIRISSHALPYN